MAGMDGNRTHPGRLNSAPQTVLKTAEDTSPRSSPASRASILAVSPTNRDATRDEIRQPTGRPLPTFLKTAVLRSANVCGRPRKMKSDQRESATVRFRPPGFAKMAVSLAVKTGPGHVFRGSEGGRRLPILGDRDRRWLCPALSGLTS